MSCCRQHLHAVRYASIRSRHGVQFSNNARPMVPRNGCDLYFMQCTRFKVMCIPVLLERTYQIMYKLLVPSNVLMGCCEEIICNGRGCWLPQISAVRGSHVFIVVSTRALASAQCQRSRARFHFCLVIQIKFSDGQSIYLVFQAIRCPYNASRRVFRRKFLSSFYAPQSPVKTGRHPVGQLQACVAT